MIDVLLAILIAAVFEYSTLWIAAVLAYSTLWITRQIPEVYEIVVYLGVFGMTVAFVLMVAGVR